MLIPDKAFAITIFPLAIMISGLAIMIFVFAQGIFWKNKVKQIMSGFTPLPSPAIALFIGISRVGETGEGQLSYSSMMLDYQRIICLINEGER